MEREGRGVFRMGFGRDMTGRVRRVNKLWTAGRGVVTKNGIGGREEGGENMNGQREAGQSCG